MIERDTTKKSDKKDKKTAHPKSSGAEDQSEIGVPPSRNTTRNKEQDIVPLEKTIVLNEKEEEENTKKVQDTTKTSDEFKW